MASHAPLFFPDASGWRKWLEKHSATVDELWVGFHKKASGKPSMTWAESVDEALCVGWIDGLRKGIDENSYKIRFTPRRPGSTWSLVNTKAGRGARRARTNAPRTSRGFGGAEGQTVRHLRL